MLAKHALAVVILALLAAGWVAVQNAWRRSFRDAAADPDVLARRMACKGAATADAGREGSCGDDKCTGGCGKNDERPGAERAVARPVGLFPVDDETRAVEAGAFTAQEDSR